MSTDLKLFAGTANPNLAAAIAERLSMSTDRTILKRFSDGELSVELINSVRGCKAVIVQSTSCPANDTLMELMLMVDALRRASVDEIIAVVPYFGYSRQDRRPGYSRMPISARVVADMLQQVGVDHLVTVDLHATQIQGFFTIPVDNISAAPLFVNDISSRWMSENPIIISPDVGGVARARALAKHLGNMDLAIIDKRRPTANVSEVMNIIGDVSDRTCIVIDDMVDTAGTLCKGADALLKIGKARRVVAYASHGVLSGEAYDRITASGLGELVVTNTIGNIRTDVPKVRQLNMASLLADTILRVHCGQSLRVIMDNLHD